MLALWNPPTYATPVWVGTFLTATISGSCLARLWWAGELYGVQELVFVAWYVVTLAVQLASQGPRTTYGGYLSQAILAIVLVLKQKMDDMQ